MPTQSPTTPTNTPKTQGMPTPNPIEEQGEQGKDNGQPIEAETDQDTISPQPTRQSNPLKLSPKRTKANWVRIGHRNRITCLIKDGNAAGALIYANKHKELEWYEHKLAILRPDLVGDCPIEAPKEESNGKPGSPQPIASSDLGDSHRTMSILLSAGQPSQGAAQQEQTGGEGGRESGEAKDLDQSTPVGEKRQCPLDVPAIPCTVWPQECVGVVVGYCGNKQLMQLEVEATLTVPGFVDNVVKGRKVCSVWKGGYNLFVGERVRVKLERAIGEEAWYEVVARDATVGREAIEGKGPGTVASNDGMTAAPVGFAGQAMRGVVTIAPAEEVPANAKETALEPTLDNVQDLAERERQKAFAEMSQQAFTGAEL